jgi:dipeptidyl aminopeptidase/acylaminoacyl peptidase
MRVITRVAGNMVLAMLGTAAGALFQTAPAAAATPVAPSLIAYVRSGDVWVSKGATETKLTTGGGWSRPRFSPDGRSIALLKGGQLWTMKADGSAKRRLTTRAASGPSWSPDGTTIAFASLSCSGGPGVYQISATAAAASPTVLFPAYCREEELPAEPAPTAKAAASTSLSDRLRTDDAVAWSPDGTRVAFRGGDCESTYDACLTVGTVATGGEKTVAAYGGGSLQTSGFAVVPNWRTDGAKLSWTAYQKGETVAENQPLHVVEYDTATGTKRTVGADQDRELAYVDANRAAATGTYRNGSWIMLVNLATGARTPFHQGSQPSVQPVR